MAKGVKREVLMREYYRAPERDRKHPDDLATCQIPRGALLFKTTLLDNANPGSLTIGKHQLANELLIKPMTNVDYHI